MALGHQVKKYREQLGWTFLQLEEHSGVDIGTINALEKRDSKRSEYASQLARAMGLSLDQLLDESRTYTAHATPLATDKTGVYNIPAAQPQETASLPITLGALAKHMSGLDPPMRASIGIWVANLCANPDTAANAIGMIQAMLAAQGNSAAQKSTNSQAA